MRLRLNPDRIITPKAEGANNDQNLTNTCRAWKESITKTRLRNIFNEGLYLCFERENDETVKHILK